MTLGGEEEFKYTPENASAYDTLGVTGNTYEIGFDAVRKSLGRIVGRVFLDFGCGTGRSAIFLRALGADYVCGVDHDRNMVDTALSKKINGVTFTHIDGVIPLKDASVDGAVSLSVFIEIRTLSVMKQVCSEVARVVRPGGPFIIMSTSPAAFGHTFRSFSYPSTEILTSGSLTECIVASPGRQFAIDDTYWSEGDYVSVLLEAGFSITSISYPLPANPHGWSTDEATVAPFIVIRALRL